MFRFSGSETSVSAPPLLGNEPFNQGGESLAVVVITGASSGIGEATARLLAAKGHRLVLVARREHLLIQLAGELKADGHTEILVIAADVAEPATMSRVVAEALDRFGHIDVWVNNAGIGQGSHPFWELDLAQIERVLDVDLLAPILACRAVIPQMIAQGSGHIINVASVAGHIGTSPLYSAAKFGLRGLSEGLRRQLAPHGVSVSIVSHRG